MPTLETLEIVFKAKKTEDAVKNIKDLAVAVSNLSNSLKTLDASKLSTFTSSMETLKNSVPTKGQTNRMVGFANAVTDLTNAIGTANITTFANDMSTMGQAVQMLKGKTVTGLTNAVTAVTQLGQQAQQTANIVQNATNNMPKVANIQGNTPAMNNQLQYTVETLDKVTVKAKGVQGILSKLGVSIPTKPFKNLEQSAEKIRAQYNDLRKEMQSALNSGTLDPNSGEFKKQEAQLDALRNKYDELILKQKELALSGGAFTVNPNFAKAYQSIGQAVGGIKQAFGGVASTVQTVNKYIDSFISKIRGVSSASRKAKNDTVSLTDSFKKFAKEVTRLSKMLKLMITRMALRAVIKEVGNGFKSLALHSQEFDSAMSNLINSSKTLGYSVSGMAGELLNALAPVLLKIIELVNRVINALNQLFAALRGKSSWNKAKEFTGSWSDSIKAANKNAKELKKTVLGFDELNQLTDNNNSGGGGSDITDMFEDVPIDPWFKDLADKIKDWAERLFAPIKSAWDKVGQWVKDKWKYALDELVKLGASVAKDFWRVWEQPETEQIFKNLLIIVGEIGRTVGNLAKQFRIAWEENDTGYKILVAIRDLILIITNHLREMATATADWAATLDFRPLLTSIQGYLESLKPAMDAIMQILQDFYQEVVLKFTKWVIESGLPKLIDVFKRFNQEVDWDGLREKLRKLWQHLEPFMETVGEGLIIFIERLTTKLKDFINGEKFEKFLEYIEDWMDRVTPEDVADGIEKLVKALIAFKIAAIAISGISGAATVISGIVTACKGLAAVASGVGSFVSAIGGLGGALLPVVAIAAAFAAAIYSLIQSYGGLEGAIAKVRDTIGKATDKLKEFAERIGLSQTDFKHDAIDDFTSSMKDLGKQLGNLKGLWDALFFVVEKGIEFIGIYAMPIIRDLIQLASGFIQIISGVIQTIGGLFDIIVGFFTGDSERVSQGAHNMWDGIKKAFDGGVKWVESLLKGLADLIIAPFRTAKEMLVGDPIVIDMWDDIKKVFSDSIGKIVEDVKKFKDDVVGYFKDLYDKAKQKIDDLKAKFTEWKDKVKETKDNIKQSVDEIKSNTISKIDELKSKVGEFKNDWSQKWSDAKAKIDEFKTNTASKLESLKGDFNTFKSTIQQAFSRENWTFSGVAEGLGKTFEDAKSAIKGVWNSIADNLNGSHEIGSSSFEINLPKFYATGGFPEDGLFFANHNELVGEFSNGKTAVANNAQIVSGIEKGVYNAVSNAMARNGGNDKYIVTEINVDGEKLATAVSKGQSKNDRRYSPSMA